MANKYLGIIGSAFSASHQERLSGVHKTSQGLLPFSQICKTVTVGPLCSLLEMGEYFPLKISWKRLVPLSSFLC